MKLVIYWVQGHSVSAASLDKSELRVRRMFGAIAPMYDTLNHLLSLNIDRYWRWRTTQLAPPRGSDPILDVCTGTGDLALAYLKSADAGVQVYGSDFCGDMLTLACKKSRQKGSRTGEYRYGQVTGTTPGELEKRTTPRINPEKTVSLCNSPPLQGGGVIESPFLASSARNHPIRFVQADTQKLPFPENFFQIVCVGFGLRNVTNTDLGLAEMTRVTKPGGRVVVLEFSKPRNSVFNRFYQWYFQYVLPLIGQTISRSREMAYQYLPNSVKEFPDGEALLERFRGQGLVNCTWTPLTFGIASVYIGEKP